MMLYDRWREVARERRSEWALHEVETGRRWSFNDLAAAAEDGTGDDSGSLVFPQGHSSDFVSTVLRAWRNGQAVCPLEPGQEPPGFSRERNGCVHWKRTSASTGPARWIGFRPEQLMADARQIISTMGLRPEWPNLGMISLAHSYGFSNLVLPLLLHGIPLVLSASALPESIKAAAAVVPGPVTVAGVPALWRAWEDAESLPANLSLAISAGAALPLELEDRVFRRTGVKIHNFYGASECGGIAFDRSNIIRPATEWVGTLLDGVEVSLDEEGCVVVESAAVGEGYFPEADPRLEKGRFVTTDLGEWVNGGLLLKGRLGDLINVAGRKVAPETIEAALRRSAAVEECVVFGVPTGLGGRGEKIATCVRLRAPVSESDLRELVSQHLPSWQVPREWWFVDQPLANARGKTSRAKWREKFCHAFGCGR